MLGNNHSSFALLFHSVHKSLAFRDFFVRLVLHSGQSMTSGQTTAAFICLLLREKGEEEESVSDKSNTQCCEWCAQLNEEDRCQKMSKVPQLGTLLDKLNLRFTGAESG